MKELIFISASPDDLVFAWQYEVFIESVRRLGYKEEIRILLFLPHDRLATGWRPIWDELEERYRDQNVRFFRYRDETNILALMQAISYIPLLRPEVLRRHFADHPELKEKAIFYHDSDIVFTKYLDFSPFLSDDVAYMSDTRGYINSDYWDSKERDVIPIRLDSYKQLDVLNKTAELVGINRQICEKNKDSSGGAQYLMKNLDFQFWDNVFNSCVQIRSFLFYGLRGINAQYFENENKGIQSWCADMWAVLWNLWKRGDETKVPKELDFAWATDGIQRWDQVYIYHDAGAHEGSTNLFFKRIQPYIDNERTPYDDDLSFVSKDFCSSLYVEQIKEVAKKYYPDKKILQ